jgi:hypothetical protein
METYTLSAVAEYTTSCCSFLHTNRKPVAATEVMVGLFCCN